MLETTTTKQQERWREIVRDPTLRGLPYKVEINAERKLILSPHSNRHSWAEMEATGDPSTIAPEICVEVMSDTNTEAEMEKRQALYFEAGAEEVWIVAPGDGLDIYGPDGLKTAPTLPRLCRESFPDDRAWFQPGKKAGT
jgi:Uma2 family endonuclease